MVDSVISSRPAPSANIPVASGKAKKSDVSVASVPTTQRPSLPKLVRLANDLAAQGPPVDFARIAEIRQAIALGTYRVDANRIAVAMLDFGDKPDQ